MQLRFNRSFPYCVFAFALLLGLGARAQALPATPGWYQIPNTALKPLCPAYPDIQATSGCPSVIQAWGSALADTSRNRMILWGGGHGDYFGNEVFMLDLNANPIKMSLAKDASHGADLSGAGCPESNPDGTPTSRHTYLGLNYLPKQDWYEMFGAGLPHCGSFSNQMWKLDASFHWTQLPIPNPHPNPGNGGSQPLFAYDSVTDKLYFLEGNAGEFWSYSGASNTWKQLQTNVKGCYNQNSSAVIDPVRRLYICTGAGGAWKISLKSYSVTALKMTGCGKLTSANAPGWEYDPTQGREVGWYGGDTVYIYNPDTDSCTSQAYSGSPRGGTAISCDDGNGQQCEGTYGRFRYFPLLGVFILVNDISEDAYSLRLAVAR